ncbi:MAG: hypothetical protein KJ011_03295 [Burkholderiaceae bacterium]|nr:hypothetical protein [Burkholderiaceae bacterium]
MIYHALDAVRRHRGRWLRLPASARLPAGFPVGRIQGVERVVPVDKVEDWLRDRAQEARCAGSAPHR